MRYPKWKTKDGKEIPINRMENSHLLNCLRFLRRYATVKYDNAVAQAAGVEESLSGEQAQYLAGQMFDDLNERKDWKHFVPLIFCRMVSVVRKRGLDLTFLHECQHCDGSRSMKKEVDADFEGCDCSEQKYRFFI